MKIIVRLLSAIIELHLVVVALIAVAFMTVLLEHQLIWGLVAMPWCLGLVILITHGIVAWETWWHENSNKWGRGLRPLEDGNVDR